MKILRRILWSLLGLVVAVMIVGLFLPSQVSIERSIVVKADAAEVYDLIANPTNFSKWSPWHEKDTAMEITFFDPLYGKGAGYTWKSEVSEVGSGRYEIISVDPGKQIDVEMNWDEMGPSFAKYIITQDPAGSKLVWTFEKDMGSWPLMRWMGLLMDPMLGSDYEKGLAKFKTVIEKAPKAHVASISEQQFPGMDILSVTSTINPRLIGSTLAKSYGAIMQNMGWHNLTMMGSPMAIYHTWSPSKTTMEAAVPVALMPVSAGKMDLGGEVIVGQMKPGATVVADYFGPYERTGMAHDALANWAIKNGKQLMDAPWEIYVTDPTTEPDQSKWNTKVCYRVK
ncbi:MAG: SRPBCC family protein [Ignavibacteria bacterium]|nr:SRPBCC family protein [Ignavibacteria bacterium]